MKTVNTIILSGACCNPQLGHLDERVKARISEISDKKQIQINISVISISSAAIGGLGLDKEIDNQIKSLIAAKGMSVLPIVIFDGTIAFYGGLASAQIIEEKLNYATQS